MKNFSFIKQSLGIILLAVLIFSACTKQDNPIFEEVQSLEIDKTYVGLNAIDIDRLQIVSGVLVFQNLGDFRSSLLVLNRLDRSNFQQWQTKMGFNSLFGLYEQLIDQEWGHYQNGNSGHTSLYNRFLTQGIIKELQYDDIHYYSMNLFNPGLSKIINQQGIVQIGDDIYFLQGNTLMIWRNGNLENLTYLLQANEKSEGVEVYVFDQQSLMLRGMENWSDQCFDFNASEMMIVEGVFNAQINEAIPSEMMVKYFFQIKNLVISSGKDGIINPEPIVNVTGKSETAYWYAKSSDPGSSNLEIIANVYDETFEGGDIYFSLEENGGFSLEEGFIFMEPLALEANYFEFTRMNTTTPMSCTINFN